MTGRMRRNLPRWDSHRQTRELMKFSNVKWIYLREVRDQLRDRRTLFTIAVLPLLLYPLMGLSFLQIAQFSRAHPTPILMAGAGALPEMPPLLDDQQRLVVDFCPPAEARLIELHVEAGLPAGVSVEALPAWSERQIQSGRYDAIVYFPAAFGQRLAEFRAHADSAEPRPATANGDVLAGAPEPALYWNAASDKSRIARDRVDGILRRWREALVEANLRDRHVPTTATKPFLLVSTVVAREHSRRAAVWS